jgi:hypothetical protein
VLGEPGARRALALLRDIERCDDLAPLWAALQPERGEQRR